jgi:ATP-dependent DNA helicase RecG
MVNPETPFVETVSPVQDLTFERVRKEFTARRALFGSAQRQRLGIVNADGLYTNLGLLLSDQCLHTTKVAVFDGVGKAVFKSRKEFSGSLVQQYHDIIAYLDSTPPAARDYPADAIREAVSNALVHRDYGLPACTFINVYDDRAEFLTIGGLAPGATLPAIQSGISICRNEALADAFCKLEMAEAYGTGISRIMAPYALLRRKPEIQVTDGSFMLTLPNVHYGDTAAAHEPKLPNAHYGEAATVREPSVQERAVLELILRNGYTTSRALAAELRLGNTRCYNILRKMQSEDQIVAIRNGRRFEYRLKP